MQQQSTVKSMAPFVAFQSRFALMWMAAYAATTQAATDGRTVWKLGGGDCASTCASAGMTCTVDPLYGLNRTSCLTKVKQTMDPAEWQRRVDALEANSYRRKLIVEEEKAFDGSDDRMKLSPCALESSSRLWLWFLHQASTKGKDSGFLSCTGHNYYNQALCACEPPTETATTTSTSITTTVTETATTTSTSITTMVTTTTTDLPNCSASHMWCPAPAHSAGTYSILGSENKTPCLLQSSGGQSFFEFAVSDCNSTRTTDETSGLVRVTITMIYRPPDYGKLIVTGNDSTAATVPLKVLCICESPLRIRASSGQMRTVPLGAGSGGIASSFEFRLAFTIHLTDAFDSPFSAGDVLPASSKRVYLEIASLDAEYVIGLTSCVASPTNNIDDPYAVGFLSAGCLAGPVDLKTHPENEMHIARISVLSFRFAGSDGVFMWCEAMRCVAEPCGECDGQRRLREGSHSARRLQGEGRRIQSWFRAQSLAQVVLPGPIILDALPVWGPPAVPWRGGFTVQSNITLWGSLANVSEAFLDAFAGAIASQMSSIFMRQVEVMRIFAPGNTPRLLTSSSAASSPSVAALIAECLLAVARQEELELVMAKFASLDGDGTAASFAQSLQASIGFPTRISVNFGPATIKRSTEVNTSAKWSQEVAAAMPEDHGPDMGSTLLVVSSLLVMIIIGCACTLGAALCWWKMRLRTPPPKCVEVNMQKPPAEQAVDCTPPPNCVEVNMQKPPAEQAVDCTPPSNCVEVNMQKPPAEQASDILFW